MSTASRWYAYLVCFISVQAVVWALIALARLLLTSSGTGGTGESLALDVSIIVIALPIYLGHWLWVRRQPEERTSTASRLYLYAILGVLLVPILANAYDLLAGMLAIPFPDAPHWRTPTGLFMQSLLHALAALVILGTFWLYHRRLLTSDMRDAPDTPATAFIRRLYLLLFCVTGLTIIVLAVIGLLVWLFEQFSFATHAIRATSGWTDNLAALLVGGMLYFFCWQQAQALFQSQRAEETQSALRKLYLYGVVFISAIVTVTSLTITLAEILRRLFGLPAATDLRISCAFIIVPALVWLIRASARRMAK